jgi:hypothetical protein
MTKTRENGHWAEISFLPRQWNLGCQDGSGPELEMPQFSLAGRGREDKLILAAALGGCDDCSEPERNSLGPPDIEAHREVLRLLKLQIQPLGSVRVKDRASGLLYTPRTDKWTHTFTSWDITRGLWARLTFQSCSPLVPLMT